MAALVSTSLRCGLCIQIWRGLDSSALGTRTVSSPASYFASALLRSRSSGKAGFSGEFARRPLAPMVADLVLGFVALALAANRQAAPLDR